MCSEGYGHARGGALLGAAFVTAEAGRLEPGATREAPAFTAAGLAATLLPDVFSLRGATAAFPPRRSTALYSWPP